MEIIPAFVLFSALLLQIIKAGENQESNSDFNISVPEGCVGNTICSIKPINYPVKQIDRLARRMAKRRRRHTTIEQESVTDATNNCVEKRENIQPFLFLHNSTQHLVIQSMFLTQVIEAVTCRNEGSPCFQSLNLTDPPSCNTKYSSWSVATYNFKQKKVENFQMNIPVDCECGLI